MYTPALREKETKMNRRTILAAGAMFALTPLSSAAQATPEPCAMATPLAAHEPSSMAWSLRGEGYQVSDPVELPVGTVYMTIDAQGNGFLHIDTMRVDDGQWIGLGVNAPLPFAGTVIGRIPAPGRYAVFVQGESAWSLWIEHAAPM